MKTIYDNLSEAFRSNIQIDGHMSYLHKNKSLFIVGGIYSYGGYEYYYTPEGRFLNLTGFGYLEYHPNIYNKLEFLGFFIKSKNGDLYIGKKINHD
jgi:hypothetical protein